MKRNSVFFFLILFFFSCQEKNRIHKLNFEESEFTLQSFEWDSYPYKSSIEIKDSIIEKKGLQYAAWAYSYIGDIKKTLESWDGVRGPADSISNTAIDSFKSFKAVSAKDYILKKSKAHDVLIINEGHHMPQHRVFTESLLKDLFDRGYRHLGLETLFYNHKSDSTLYADKYPSMKAGYYTKEPQFGNLVRSAIKMGYSVFGYESMGHEERYLREVNQAKNILKYLENKPKAKTIIHCGFDHAAEGEIGKPWYRAMAARLTEYSGIDPLTINQVKYGEKSKRSFENPFYQLTDVQEASIFLNSENQSFGTFRDSSWMDLFVFHPRTNHNSKRPDWLLINDRKIETLDLSAVNLEAPFLVYAYRNTEKLGYAVPCDIQECKDKNKLVHLVLSQDEHQIVLSNGIQHFKSRLLTHPE